MTSLSFVGVEH